MTNARLEELDLIKIAVRQRQLLYVVLAMVIINLISIYLGVTGTSTVPVAITAWILHIAITIAGIGAVIRILVAMRQNVASAVLFGLVMIIPILSVLVLLSVSNQATTILRLAGAKVGLLGVSSTERDKLRQGHCRGCGYERKGLELLAPCPECNRVPVVW